MLQLQVTLTYIPSMGCSMKKVGPRKLCKGKVQHPAVVLSSFGVRNLGRL